MTWFLVISCVVCGWAMLRIIGSERTTLIAELEARLKKEAPPPPPPPADPPPAEAKTAATANKTPTPGNKPPVPAKPVTPAKLKH
jgi:hypothetical protein